METARSCFIVSSAEVLSLNDPAVPRPCQTQAGLIEEGSISEEEGW